MNSIFVFHGSFSSPFENWFSSVNAWGNEHGRKVYVPHLPSPEKQTFENWASVIDAYAKMGLVDGTTTFVGHSSGAALAIKYLLERKQRIAMLVTVCGFNNYFSGDTDYDAINRSLFVAHEALQDIPKLADRRVTFYSDNDPFIPIEKYREFSTAVEADTRLVPGAGHFNAESGYTTFPDLTNLLAD